MTYEQVIDWTKTHADHPKIKSVMDELTLIEMNLKAKHNHYSIEGSKRSLESLPENLLIGVVEGVHRYANSNHITLVANDKSSDQFHQVHLRMLTETIIKAKKAGAMPKSLAEGLDISDDGLIRCPHDVECDSRITSSIEYIESLIK